MNVRTDCRNSSWSSVKMDLRMRRAYAFAAKSVGLIRKFAVGSVYDQERTRESGRPG
jgi:hypothetical protein